MTLSFSSQYSCSPPKIESGLSALLSLTVYQSVALNVHQCRVMTISNVSIPRVELGSTHLWIDVRGNVALAHVLALVMTPTDFMSISSAVAHLTGL